MAYDEGIAQVMREDLHDFDGLKEVRMFGGICFMHHGHMLCGVHKDGALYRVGKERHALALERDGVEEMTMTGRSMGGLVDVEISAIEEDQLRADLLEMALAFTASLPPK